MDGACCGTSRRASSYASRAASGRPSCCSSWPTRANANAVFSGARPGDAAARCIASSAPGRSPCSSRTYDRRARLVRSADCSTRRSTASEASSYRPSSIRASTTTARGARRRRVERRRRLADLERLGELVLAEQDAAEADQRKRVIGAEPTGRLERVFRGRVERRVGRLADPLQQREAELELRLAVIGVLGDASGEELDEALGWRRRWAALQPVGAGDRDRGRRLAGRRRWLAGRIDRRTVARRVRNIRRSRVSSIRRTSQGGTTAGLRVQPRRARHDGQSRMRGRTMAAPTTVRRGRESLTRPQARPRRSRPPIRWSFQARTSAASTGAIRARRWCAHDRSSIAQVAVRSWRSSRPWRRASYAPWRRSRVSSPKVVGCTRQRGSRRRALSRARAPGSAGPAGRARP